MKSGSQIGRRGRKKVNCLFAKVSEEIMQAIKEEKKEGGGWARKSN